MGGLQVGQPGDPLVLGQPLQVEHVADRRRIELPLRNGVETGQAQLQRIVVEKQGAVEVDPFLPRVVDISGLQRQGFERVSNGVAFLVPGPVDAPAAVAAVDQIDKLEPVPEDGHEVADAALAREEGADLAVACQGSAQSQHLVVVAIGVGSEPLFVAGGEVIRLGEKVDIPLCPSGAQLLQDDRRIGAAVLGVEAPGLQLNFLQRFVDQGHRGAPGDDIAHIRALDVVAHLVAARTADVDAALVVHHSRLQTEDILHSPQRKDLQVPSADDAHRIGGILVDDGPFRLDDHLFNFDVRGRQVHLQVCGQVG